MRRGLDGFFWLLPAPSAVFKVHGGRLAHFRWRDSERETPLPIPNRAVKPLSAGGTCRATARESRSPPVFIEKSRPRAALFRWRKPRGEPPLPAWRALPNWIGSRGPAAGAAESFLRGDPLGHAGSIVQRMRRPGGQPRGPPLAIPHRLRL